MTYLSVFYFVKNGPFISLQELCPTIHPVRNIKLDHHDHPETVSVTLYIKSISQESLKVDFEEKSISVTFRTRYKILSLILLLVITQLQHNFGLLLDNFFPPSFIPFYIFSFGVDSKLSFAPLLLGIVSVFHEMPNFLYKTGDSINFKRKKRKLK